MTTYQVFARKYRPQTFADVVGQDLIVKALRNSVVEGRVANVYLLTGPRGTGKTSLARILAKALNCKYSKDGEPCNKCTPCINITDGMYYDVDEFDAASNRKVEDAEYLLDKVAASPLCEDTKYKVFIIDEVHMLTGHAFGALLKTMEEPPVYVKFILATTNPESIPDTILSRCIRFPLRKITVEDIAKRLQHICELEGIKASPGVLKGLAKRAKGVLRDSLMLLDQCVAICGNELKGTELQKAFGPGATSTSLALLEAIASGKGPGRVLEVLGEAFKEGVDTIALCTRVQEIARDMLLIEAAGPEAAKSLVEAPGSIPEIEGISKAIGTGGLLYILSHVAELEKKLETTRDERILLEVTFARLTMIKDLIPLGTALEKIMKLEYEAEKKG